MGKAVIVRDNGAGHYVVRVSLYTDRANMRLNRLNGILAAVQTEIDTGAIGARFIFLNARKVALEKEVNRLESAVDAAEEVDAWCADLSPGLAGEVGTIEIGTERKNGIQIQPGYQGMNAYNGARDGIETPVKTLPVSTAIFNFALMPAIQKWRPTYRYGEIISIDHDNNRCDVVLDQCNSSIMGIDINVVNTITGAPIEYMSCNHVVFEPGDAVLVRFDPYSINGQPKVIGFKNNPKPCESRYIRIQTGSAILIYDIVGQRIGGNLPDNPPTFPCEKTTQVNSWLAAHVSESAINTDVASISNTITESYVDPVNSLNDLVDDYHFDIFPTYEDSFRSWSLGTRTVYDEGEWDCDEVFYDDGPPSHTGDTLQSTYGPYKTDVTTEAVGYDLGPNNEPRYFLYWNRYMDCFQPLVCRGGMCKVVSCINQQDRSFIVSSDSEGTTLEDYQTPPIETHDIYSDLIFHSPFENAPVHIQQVYHNADPSAWWGESIAAFSIAIGAKRSGDDMLNFCIFTYLIHENNGDTYTRPQNLPVARMMSKTGIDNFNDVNPFDDLNFDPVLSSAVADFINNFNNGALTGLSIDFIDVS
jgi:hypothetical protein